MIDEYSTDRTGWARFSDDRVMRYRLARSLTGAPLLVSGEHVLAYQRVVFLMLNPSTADAFKVDPTVNECRMHAERLGGDVLEVVNLFAFRSSWPEDLKTRAAGFRGDDEDNNRAIIAACSGAKLVIAAWGNHGELGARDAIVCAKLRERAVPLSILGLTGAPRLAPKHPLARGKHRIPRDVVPQPWSMEAARG